MSIVIDVMGALAPYFTQDAIADMVSDLPPVETPIKNLLYPEANQKQKNSPYIKVSDIIDTTGAPPVVRRGSRAYPVDGTSEENRLIEVQPIKLSSFLLGKEINDLIALGRTESIDAIVREKIEYLRDETSKASEIMACQSLSGEISYPLATGESIDSRYDIAFGTINTMPAANIASDDLGKLRVKLEAQLEAQRKTGASGDVRFLAADDVYTAISAMIFAAGANPPVVWTEYGFILFGRYKIMSMSNTFVLPGETASRPVIPAGYLQTVDLKKSGMLFYASLDDMDANLAPLPFYAKPLKSDNPSGVTILSESKPLCAPAVKKMVRRKVLN